MFAPIRSSIVLVVVLLASFQLRADVTFIAPSGTLNVGENATFSVTADAYDEVIGFAYGICPAPGSNQVSVVAVQPGAALMTFGGPDFFQEEIEPGGVVGSHSVGCVFDFFGMAELPWGAGQELAQVTYQGVAPGTTELCFCDVLGSPPVETVYVNGWGGTQTPFQECGTITVGWSCAPVADLSCQFDSETQQVFLAWTNSSGYSFHDIFRNGTLIGSLSGDDTSFVDSSPESSNEYVVQSYCHPSDTVSSSCSIDLPSAGDVNGDGLVNIGDAIYLLNFLNSSGPAPVLSPCP